MSTYYFYNKKELDGKIITKYSNRLPKTFEHFFTTEPTLKKLFTEGSPKEMVTFSDYSTYSKIKQYIDGLDNIFNKHVYAELFENKYYNPETYTINSNFNKNKLSITE